VSKNITKQIYRGFPENILAKFQ